MVNKFEKTNVMRILDQKGIQYNYYFFDSKKDNVFDVANSYGQNLAMVFKTLVTSSRSKEYYVFMVPVEKELDLKKAAKVAGEKAIEMIPQKELLSLTGYVHGGCSPIGMKKRFKTFIDHSVVNCGSIYFSGGRVGCQVELALSDLKKIIPVIPKNITRQI
ncbi:Cys-tRNA(Pro) deacylase [Paenibacillus polymyxa]|uniref:Cys-tRNA(Pro) deacylase n=1 Tax=Paenibacillus polymyxa TaxID=1406 RepID=UPI00234937A4|nr:Cys-tRNA(Pro) deacylase [Paenibacillus polymyxa]WCM60737.1 Cys-tRNA(Pro) deacylase [Paenibacillus polymyxa]